MPVQELPAAQIIGVGFDVFGRRLADSLFLLGQQLDLQLVDDCVRDIILDGEYVSEVPVVAVRPDVRARHGVDQLSSDAHPIVDLPHAAFDHVADPQLATDLDHAD